MPSSKCVHAKAAKMMLETPGYNKKIIKKVPSVIVLRWWTSTRESTTSVVTSSSGVIVYPISRMR